jgi:hypothetical protein
MGWIDDVVNNLPSGFVHNASVSFLSVTQVNIGNAGLVSTVLSSDNTTTIFWSGLIPIDITVAGAGGLDAGIETPDTWYAVYVIADSTGVNPVSGILSTSAVAPVMPAGYDKFRRLGWVRNNPISDFWNFFQKGNENQRIYEYNEEAFFFIALAGGTAIVFTPVDFSPFMPPTSTIGRINFGFQSDTKDSVLFMRPNGSPVTFTRTFFQNGLPFDALLFRTDDMITDNSQMIEYMVTSIDDEALILVMGFIDYL